MPSLAPFLDRARRCHRAGDVRQAEQLRRQTLRDTGKDPHAWHLLGTVLQVRDDWKRRSLLIVPRYGFDPMLRMLIMNWVSR